MKARKDIPALTCKHLRVAIPGVLVLAIGPMATTDALAGEWTITPSLEITETITDNVTVVDSGSDTDSVTTVNAGIGVNGEGARVKVNLHYNLSFDKYLDHDELDGIRHNLLGAGNAEVVKEHFFIDARASVSEVSTQRNQISSATERSLTGNRSRVINVSLTPRYEQRFGNWADATLQYRISHTSFGNTDVGSSANAPGDSIDHLASVALSSGPKFGRLGLTAKAERSVSERDATTNSERTTLSLSGSYVINPRLTLLATVGHDDFNDNQINASKLGGTYGHGGFRYTPGPRTELRLEAGRRYDDPYFNGDASYNFAEGATIRARYAIDVVTQQQALIDRLSRLEVDENGTLVDPTTGQPSDPSNLQADLVDVTTVSQNFVIGLNISRLRNKYALSFSHTDRELPTGDHDKIISLTGSAARELSPRTTASANLSYSQSLQSGTGNGEDRTVRSVLTVTNEIGPSVTGALTYSFLYREADMLNNSRENTLSLRMNFKF